MAQTGACCAGTACTATSTGCTGASIFVLGGACTPNACAGACCSGVGACTITVSGACSGASTFLGIGSLCSPTTICNQYLGSCCSNLGACTANVMPANCTGTSIFQGFGSVCSPNPCAASVGACCSVTGACTLTAATGCAQPSTFTAVGTACTGTPCTIPTGACCAADGTCAVKNASGTGAGACGGTPGDSYQGDNSPCSPNPCAAFLGSCCSPAITCTVRTVAGCAGAANQIFAGVGTTCTTNPCVTGACCSYNGTCSLTIATGCTATQSNFGGSTYLGNGTTCSAADICATTLTSGACCPNGSGACQITVPNGCVGFATFVGANSTCAPTDSCAPLRGACCSGAGACSSTVVRGCFGFFNGAGSSCSPTSPCSTLAGACCNAVGGCFVALPTGCTGVNSFRGVGSACLPTSPCIALQGACCSGVGSCTVTILSGCTGASTFSGAGTSCAANPCPALRGACCSSLGTCSITIASGCTGANSFQGAGASCFPNHCIPTAGSCCNLDAGTCSQTTAIACVGANVAFDAGTACNPGNPCAQPSGACCIGTNCSAAQPAGFCTAAGGLFVFNGVCSPNPCVRPQVVISQIFGGGGNVGAPYRYDYVELFNRGTTTVAMTNWSLQFGSPTTQTFPSRAIFSGSIAPGHYFLVQLSSSNLANGSDLPVAPDWTATESVNLDAASGRLALVSGPNALSNGCPVPFPVNIVDFVGYGPGAGVPNCSEGGSPTGSSGGAIYAFYRRANGCQDTDNNGADFTQPLAPNPRNSSSSYICGSTTTGACCTGESCALATLAACASAPVGFMGEGTTCAPNNPCLTAKGSCCDGLACTFVAPGTCLAPSIYTFGRACNPDPCSGACCTGTTCVATAASACTGASYFITGASCTPGRCPTPVVVQSGDIIYGASVGNNEDAIQQIRGAGAANPTRVGTWTRYNGLQIVRLDNTNGVLHNASGNLLGMDFGSTTNGGAIYNLPTNGDVNAGSQLFGFTGPASPFNLTRSRLGGMSVSPGNNRIACIGYDFARLYVLSYNPGGAIGTGAGASIDGGASTDNNSFVFGFNITQGTSWLDNDNILMWVLSDIANVLKIYSVPVSGSGATIALGAPVERLAVTDNKPNSSRFTSIAYNPQLIPGYIFLGASAFQGVSLNSLYVVDITGPTWQVVKTIDLGASLQTEREIVIGTDRNLYLCQFAGSAQAADPLIDKITLDANGDGVVSPAEIAALTDNSSVDFYLKGLANSSAFNAIEVAVSLGACCAGTNCSIQPPNFCSGSHGVYQGNDTACTPTNPCPMASGVCCRGATCTTTRTSAADCSGSLIGGQTAGAFFTATGTCNSAGNTTSPCCYADYNKSGAISVADIFDFLSDWFAGSPFANTGGTGNGGALSVGNIFDFLSAWFAGGC